MKAIRGLNTGISLRRDRQWSSHVLAAVWVMAMISSLTVAVEASRLARGLSTSRGTAHFVTQPTLFQQNYQAFSDAKHAVLLAGGQQVQLVLDQQAAAGFGSKSKYLFGNTGMCIKLVPGYSAGTVTSFYVSADDFPIYSTDRSEFPSLSTSILNRTNYQAEPSSRPATDLLVTSCEGRLIGALWHDSHLMQLSSDGATHDELDFEFLGNVTGQPYILQTNVYAHGVGNREQRIYLWFDPTADFHCYSVNWNQNYVLFMVDNIPIRIFKNNQNLGVPYLNSQPMAVYSSLWDGSQWATDGGRIKIDWQYAPFIATYQGFNINGCLVQNNNIASCSSSQWAQAPAVTWHQTNQLKWVRGRYLIYNYCTDKVRYPTAPPECATNIL